jgi:hypothetical protein
MLLHIIPFKRYLNIRARDKDIYLCWCYILNVNQYLSPFLGEASKGKAYSSDKGGKVSASNTVPTKSDAELKLELGQFPSVKFSKCSYFDANYSII